MPDFYVNSENKVIHKVPGGKLYQSDSTTAGLKSLGKTLSYLDNKGNLVQLPESRTAEIQSAQKEGVCAFVAAKYQFYGKFFPGPERYNEILISDYRKTTTTLTKEKAEEDELIDKFNQYFNPDIHKSEKHFAKSILDNSSNFSITHRNLLTEFIASKEDDLTYFAINRQSEALLNAAQKAAKTFDFDIAKAVAEELIANGVAINDLALEDKASFYDNALHAHIWHLQGYSATDWHPRYGLKSLLEALRETHFIATVTSNIEVNSEKAPFVEYSGKDEKGYLIFDNVAVAAEEDIDTHVIRIIGAELNDDDGNIYFIDPNNASYPELPRMIHRIPYTLFDQILRKNYDHVTSSKTWLYRADTHLNNKEASMALEEANRSQTRKRYLEDEEATPQDSAFFDRRKKSTNAESIEPSSTVFKPSN
ncbi:MULTISPECIES: hypothetical protein [unclassified Legionella]|uniref:hypothetical protein n=1 Tax=unclassified Legionella TaxID=2622702 RepID=UPI0010563F65|nr:MULTISPECIES: hypothetical protein [unclassified Legionella]MDI9818614.1 hypothetical protein [Legionella sp. PL877]